MLDAISSTPEVAVFFLILCGAAAGALVAFFLLPSPRQVRRLQEEIDALRAEHERYKGQVTSHFHKTAELVGVMTQSYKNVYDHLAQGAQTLCEGPPALPADFGEARLIADASFVVGDEAPADASAVAENAGTDATERERRATDSGRSTERGSEATQTGGDRAAETAEQSSTPDAATAKARGNGTDDGHGHGHGEPPRPADGH